MELVELYYLGELIGVSAIVVSLILVLEQLRLNTAAIHSDAAHTVNRNWRDINMEIAANESLATVISDSRRRAASVSRPEGVTFERTLSFFTAALKQSELVFLQWRSGAVEDEYWRAARDGTVFFLVQYEPPMQLWDEFLRTNFSQEYRDEFGDMAAEANARMSET